MKSFYIAVFILSLSDCMANNNNNNNNDRSNLPENFNFENLQRWLSTFQRSHSSSDTLNSESNSNNGKTTQSDDFYNERLPHHETPVVILDSDAAFDYDDDSFVDYGVQPNFPYMLRSIKVRDISSRSPYMSHTSHKTIFQSLCPTTSQIFILSNPEFEYRPDRYQNITCSHPVLPTTSKESHNVCEQIGFRCVQHRRTMLLNIRRQGTDCWKTESITIDSGCECVMPV